MPPIFNLSLTTTQKCTVFTSLIYNICKNSVRKMPNSFWSIATYTLGQSQNLAGSESCPAQNWQSLWSSSEELWLLQLLLVRKQKSMFLGWLAALNHVHRTLVHSDSAFHLSWVENKITSCSWKHNIWYHNHRLHFQSLLLKFVDCSGQPSTFKYLEKI